MKKAIVALLVSIIASFGYVVVDKPTDDRIANLEELVSSQQAVIESISNQDSYNDVTFDMEIGDSLPCYPNSGSVFYTEEGEKITIEEFSCVLTEKNKNGQPVFTLKFKGKAENPPKDAIYIMFYGGYLNSFGPTLKIDTEGYFEYTRNYIILRKNTLILETASYDFANYKP